MDGKTANPVEIGQWVKVLDWCGRVTDIARSETKIMIQVHSFKGVWNHHPTEWIEYREDMLRPATPEEIERDRERYLEHLRRATRDIEELGKLSSRSE